MSVVRIGATRSTLVPILRRVTAKASRVGPADAIVELQRCAGNAAVAPYLAGVRAGEPYVPALLPIQRCGPTPCDCSDQERAEFAATHGDEPVVQRDVIDDLAGMIAKDLAQYTAQNRNPFPHIREVFHGLDSDIEDNVAAAYTEKLSAEQLEGFAMTKDGQEVLDLLTEAMLTGHVTSFEALQADRIVTARNEWKSADEHDKAVRRVAALRHAAEDSPYQMAVNEQAMQLAQFAARVGRRVMIRRGHRIIHGVGSDVEDNVSSHLVELLTTPQLATRPRTRSGQSMLDVCYEALITGTVTPFESLQGDRILTARVKGRAISPGEVEKVLENPTIFPLETSWGSSATIVASLESGMVKVYYDTHIGAGRPKYAAEIATLTGRFGHDQVFSGMTLRPDEIVMVKLYDQDEDTRPIPAIKLIDLANRQLQDFEGKFEKVTIMGATVGVGAVGGAGVLGALDTAAFVISTASIFVDAYRSDIAKTAGGSAFLKVWDVVQDVADLYGWARLGADGLHVLRAKVGPVLRDWKAEPLTELSEAERVTVGQAQREADTWMGGVDQAESAAKQAGAGERPHGEGGGQRPHAEEGGPHPEGAREPSPAGGGTAGAAAHDASRAVGEAGSDIHVHDDHIVVCQLCEELPDAVGDAVHDPQVGSEVTDAEKAAAQGDAGAAVSKAESAVTDAEHVNNDLVEKMKGKYDREFLADPELKQRWEKVRKAKPGPARARAAHDLNIALVDARRANDAYMASVNERVAVLRRDAPVSGSAANELEAFYQGQSEWVLKELKKAERAELKKPWGRGRDIPKPKPDPTLDKAYWERKAESDLAEAKSTKTRVPHEADVVVVGSRRGGRQTRTTFRQWRRQRGRAGRARPQRSELPQPHRGQGPAGDGGRGRPDHVHLRAIRPV